ncbi:MAG: histone deacetylase [Acidobacteriota bacterium]
MSFGVVVDEAFLEHRNPPGHAERPERIQALLEIVGRLPRSVVRIPPYLIDENQILAVHSREHLERIAATAEREETMLDPDTYTNACSFEAARLAAGSAVRLVEAMFGFEIEAGFAMVRPPGHHATRNRAMGFCLFNNVAIAAQWAIGQGGMERVAIVDFDVHHGNGTEELFWSRRDVLYISSHQYPFYPGTGAAEDIGAGEGVGFTVNLPVGEGQDDAFFASLYAEIVAPILREYQPGLIIVSAGYDAHVRDPLGGMRMTADGYGELAAILSGVAREVCDGRILYVLEGGYDLQGLATSVTKSILAAVDSSDGRRVFEGTDAFAAYRREVVARLGSRWRSLAPKQ